MKQNVLITGGTGLVGTCLSQLLLEQGYTVSFLSRRKRDLDPIKVYQWDIRKQEIDTEALEKADYIIHLAGAGVMDKAWSTSYQKEILESRTLSTQLLYDQLKAHQLRPKAFVSASAIGIYGFDTGEQLLTEQSPVGEGFLADVTRQWEDSIQQLQSLDIPTSWIRVGIVLAREGGALVKMSSPVRSFVGAPLASGKQYLSWIHVQDLARMFAYLIQHQSKGPYNGVSPQPCTNQTFTKNIAKVLKRPLWLPHVPAFVLRMMLGDRADMIIGGNNVSSAKILQSGFEFEYKDLQRALEDLL